MFVNSSPSLPDLIYLSIISLWAVAAMHFAVRVHVLGFGRGFVVRDGFDDSTDLQKGCVDWKELHHRRAVAEWACHSCFLWLFGC